MSLLTSWLASPLPEAAVEISPESVSVAVLGGRGHEVVVQAHAVEPLPPGAVVPALASQNLVDRAAVIAALGAACRRAGAEPGRVALVVPDLAARVSLVHFETVPARRDDLDQLVRWQIRKSSPFPIEEAVVTYTAAARGQGDAGFVVAFARRDVVREYEDVCEARGMHAGLVDLATLSVANLFLSDETAPAGDWLLVHVRPTYTSIAVMRGPDLLFFRCRAEGEEEPLDDLVHQTAMYYQDRLGGQGFGRVFLGGAGRDAGSIDAVRRSLEARLGNRVDAIDPTRAAALTDRISTTPGVAAALAPLVGVLMRSRREGMAA